MKKFTTAINLTSETPKNTGIEVEIFEALCPFLTNQGTWVRVDSQFALQGTKIHRIQNNGFMLGIVFEFPTEELARKGYKELSLLVLRLRQNEEQELKELELSKPAKRGF